MTTKAARLCLAAMMAIGIGATTAAGQQSAKPDSFTADQVNSGRAALLVRAVSDGEEVELRRAITHG